MDLSLVHKRIQPAMYLDFTEYNFEHMIFKWNCVNGFDIAVMESDQRKN